MAGSILLVEDEPLQRQMIARMLERQLGYHAITAKDATEALAMLESSPQKSVILVIMDMNMPGMSGLEALEIIRQRHPDIPTIMLTGTEDVELAVKAMRYGASDFLNKPPEIERLRVSILNTLRVNALEKEVSRLKRQETDALTFSKLIGHDTGLADTVRISRKAAATDIPVLLTGETGVGKEVLARAIHGESLRISKPFIAVNCGAIPEQLVESTLFGHEKGAFTGAIAKANGCFREADGGTLFLDEVGELPLDAQVKLLRVLQQKEVIPVGGSIAVPVNVRIISATNRDIETEVAKGAFREDLYYRLNVLRVQVPPLRERRADIIPLAEYFLAQFAKNTNIAIKILSADAKSFLTSQPWPGNIRELENTLNRAIVMADATVLEKDDFLVLHEGSIKKTTTQDTGAASLPPYVNAHARSHLAGTFSLLDAGGNIRTLQEIEEDVIRFTIQHYDGNIPRAALGLGLSKSTLYRKMQSMETGLPAKKSHLLTEGETR